MNSTCEKRAGLIAGLQEARSRKDFEGILACADALKALLPSGELETAYREALPGVKHPTQWISRKRRQVKKRREKTAARIPTTLQPAAVDLYPRLAALRRCPDAQRSHQLELLSAEAGLSVRTLRRKLRAVDREGAAALNRKARTDKGISRTLPREAEQLFRALYTHKDTRHLAITDMVGRVREKFPELEASDATFYRIAKEIPQAARMTKQEWRARFEPSGRWEAPHPNHTWVFDMTIGDLFVWNRNPDERPYRPHLLAILDECTRSCLYARYTKEAHGTADLQSVLLRAILPKNGDFARDWRQCGAPLYLHCDNGKVQASDWLRTVCERIHTDLHLLRGVRHAAVRSPWQQGKIERFYRTVHEKFERQLGSCYCGNAPHNKPASHIPPEKGLRAWRDYPTLEALNYGLHCWLVGEYHQRRNRTIGLSPIEAWRLYAGDHVRVPEESYLRQTLMQRDQRQVRRGLLEFHGSTYYHQVLQGYEGLKLEVRWEPADLTKVLVLREDGSSLCWAQRQETRNAHSPKDLAELKQQRREKRETRKALEQVSETAKTLDSPTFEKTLEKLRKERKDAGIVDFPKGKRVRPADPDGEPSAEEIISVAGGGEADEDDFNLDILGVGLAARE